MEIRELLCRLKEASKARTDAELCRLMNIKQNTFSTWKARGQFNEKPVIEFCVNNQIDLNYIFTGRQLKPVDDSLLIKSLLKNIALLEQRLKPYSGI